jgi:hypothetical protein
MRNSTNEAALTTAAVGAAGTRSLEVRWIFPGRLETVVARWFGRFPVQTESREDRYLDPDLSGLSVKVRAGSALQVKAYCGSPGVLDVADRARGQMQSWLKWSFRLIPPARKTMIQSAGCRYTRGGVLASSRWPADRSWRGPAG